MNTRNLIVLLCFISLSGMAQPPRDEEKEAYAKGYQRDHQAADDAIKGWWPASMKDHDQRIAWWRDARFGMFIHWGVYSRAGGEWKGHKVEGYAEHLMRKEKISRKEYLDLAHGFNPVKFNAEQWVLDAKKAGMKYMIITSKHHDGFAMYDSKVSDFNVVRQTAWKKDPMAALSAACKKYGLKFGFYYSHAFDWEHPLAPGNDWEYNNPAGDKQLFGGVRWYDLHPELLARARKYVDEKAIPQIKELINKYHPDIFWFDTPSKLPFSENLRILQAIREVDTHVVINGRLARADTNFGDYKNTADRPAEFYPVTGDWEAIPTTNESYGYHKYDSSHKPSGFFIRLLAKAASRGGNLLMNIGPKGDGTFDDRDLNILHGIGKWMDVNGESIYGSAASPLPLQNWGVSTLKGDKLYLHVFDWPADGRLYVGGLKGDMGRVYPLADAGKSLRVVSDGKDLIIDVPRQAPDTANTVIVVELKKGWQTDTVRYTAPNIPLTRLLAFDAEQHGKGFGFGDGKAGRFYVEGWSNKDQYLSWHFRTAAAATYHMTIKYRAGEGFGGVYRWQMDGYQGERTIDTGGRDVGVLTAGRDMGVLTADLGTVSLTPGVHALSIRPVDIAGRQLMRLLEVDLVRSWKTEVTTGDGATGMSVRNGNGAATGEAGGTALSGKIALPQVMADVEQQTRLMLRAIATAGGPDGAGGRGPAPDSPFSPRTLENGRLKLVASRDWTSGFFPGELWMLYQYTGKEEWKKEAQAFTARMEREKLNATTHDMGFKIYCSYGAGYRLTKDEAYRQVIIQAAKTLSTRFNPRIGCIRSWDHHRNLWGFPVIIDNMMNLELLFEATKLTGDSSFYKIAVTHANTTMKNHYRDDFSSFHVVDYDTATGKVVKKMTWQGYSDASAWARGQAWGLYAYTMCYRETKDPRYLQHAERIAAFLLPRLPADKVPYWDYNAPNIADEPRDASAAAIMASGLYELSGYSVHGEEYRRTADQMLVSLTNNYRSPVGANSGFILLHSTGSKPSDSEVDVPINYGDYYYLEALLKSK